MTLTRYLITGCPRSGTTLVHLALKDHPNVAALNDELRLAPFFTEGISSFTWGNDLDQEKEEGFLALFDAITSITASHATMAIGAKIPCGSPESARIVVNVLRDYLKELKVILLIRNDLVAQYGSWVAARRTGVFHIYGDKPRERSHKLRINRWLFSSYVLMCLDAIEQLRRCDGTHSMMKCQYERLLHAPDKVYEQLFDFLGVPPIDVTWLHLRKTMPAPEEYIENYADMAKILDQLRAAHRNGTVSPKTRAFLYYAQRIRAALDVRGRLQSRKHDRATAALRESRLGIESRKTKGAL